MEGKEIINIIDNDKNVLYNEPERRIGKGKLEKLRNKGKERIE